MLRSLRRKLLPWVSPPEVDRGVRLARVVRCAPLDVFFGSCGIVLGNTPQYSIGLPLICWMAGSDNLTRFMWPLLVALFVTNATKELLRLPRPNAKNALETQYLEEFGFPSTHTAAAIVWACGLQRTVAPEVGAAVSVTISEAYCILVMFSRLCKLSTSPVLCEHSQLGSGQIWEFIPLLIWEAECAWAL